MGTGHGIQKTSGDGGRTRQSVSTGAGRDGSNGSCCVGVIVFPLAIERGQIDAGLTVLHDETGQ